MASYAMSTTIGSINHGYVYAPVTKPLSVMRSVGVLPKTSNNGVFTQLRATPAQFFPSQNPPNYSDNGMARQSFKRVDVSANVLRMQTIIGKQSSPMGMFNIGTGTSRAVSSHMNYIAPKDSSSYTSGLKRRSIGTSAYKLGLPADAPLSTKGYSGSNVVRSALGRVRSGGYTSPKK